MGNNIIRTIEVKHKGLILTIDVTYFNRGHAAPHAPTPDHAGYDDSGDPGEVEFNVVGVELMDEDEFLESFSFDDDEKLYDLVFEDMSHD